MIKHGEVKTELTQFICLRIVVCNYRIIEVEVNNIIEVEVKGRAMKGRPVAAALNGYEGKRCEHRNKEGYEG